MHIICFKSSCFFHTFFCLAVRSLLLNPNLTTVTAMKSALESSTTSTPMVSNGMTFLATTKNQLFVNFKSMDSNWSQVELTNIMKHSIAHYCLNCEKQRVWNWQAKFPFSLQEWIDRFIDWGEFEFQTGFSVLKSPFQRSESVAFSIYFEKSFPTV